MRKIRGQGRQRSYQGTKRAISNRLKKVVKEDNRSRREKLVKEIETNVNVLYVNLKASSAKISRIVSLLEQ